ncbi:MAG TPA: carboxypeptidase-like regulatory domain-containing protein [Salinimicrobium sp.]|nr:carboxypeptidase-like regulatory domain-containing protein [Salinimicrobium sp.]
MKTIGKITVGNSFFFIFIYAFLGVISYAEAAPFFQNPNQQTITYKGEVVNSRTGNSISSAYLLVVGTNISTVTNNDGEFSLKLPAALTEATITTSYLGYESKTLPLEYFKGKNTVIELDESVEKLAEVAIFDATNATSLVREMLDNRDENYVNDKILMTVFYRETIKRGRRNVSLSEAVLEIYKEPNNSSRNDDVAIVKARKSTDYERLDTLALKLRGGPFNTLYLDAMKYPDFLFANSVKDYKFSFEEPVQINDRYTYVVAFEEKHKQHPWYFGKLFIDAKTNTLVRAAYTLNVDNRREAANMFVQKKPGRSKVYPISVAYEVDYREDDGKWYYGYGNAKLTFVVNWKRKLFNSRYHVNSEMAVTDWKVLPDEKIKKEDFIKPSIIMADDVSGFADIGFWGANNIIEPEKSIQNAIDKIQRQLERNKD